MAAGKRRDSDVTIIIFLGSIVLVCIIGIIVLSFAPTSTDTQPLVAIASGCVGALATKITQGDNRGEEKKDPAADDDALATIVGRAATKSVIAEMMRQMSAPPGEPPEPPKKSNRRTS